ncbi:cyclophilin-like fold protein [Dethiosulfatarculus sandiegensis]|uniref:Cyclophilin TM1367-like domain-containing protein n=1 Tax=Dethiosulfatarculus sandiegensis TaxID=1429043 RepID=A0A0D2J8N8_9BACT|nr:cyclophilin-like fold protein [Dethiosulfatarculus sandiegensis]KIX12071.1 hypothetical protein X474_19645 [Dethiosulfatarculus sandiegensis]
MSTAIIIEVGGTRIKGELDNSPLGRALAAQLPFTWEATTWGEELYGEIDKPVMGVKQDTLEEMEIGELAYHQSNNWFCLFFGPTPMSHDTEPRAAVPICRVGEVYASSMELDELGHEVSAEIRKAD